MESHEMEWLRWGEGEDENEDKNKIKLSFYRILDGV